MAVHVMRFDHTPETTRKIKEFLERTDLEIADVVLIRYEGKVFPQWRFA